MLEAVDEQQKIIVVRERGWVTGQGLFHAREHAQYGPDNEDSSLIIKKRMLKKAEKCGHAVNRYGERFPQR